MGGKHIFPKDLGGGIHGVDQKINSFFLCCVGMFKNYRPFSTLL